MEQYFDTEATSEEKFAYNKLWEPALKDKVSKLTEMTDQEIQEARAEQRNDHLAPRQVKGRMDEPIVEVVIDHPPDKVIPIYFSPRGFHCGECEGIMAEDGFPKQGKVRAFCTRLTCSQNLITKEITLPFSDNYVVDLTA